MKKNNKIFDLFFAICLLGVVIFIVKVIDGYQDQIERQAVLINEYSSKEDSLRTNNEELIKSLNKLFKKSPVTDNGDFDVMKFIDFHNNLADSVKQLNWDLNYIKNSYGIYVKRIHNKNGNVTISLAKTDKLDSALVLLPIFRDRLKRKNKNSWEIDVYGKDYQELRNEYNSLVGKLNKANLELAESINQYKKLLKDYNKTADEYEKLRNTYNESVKRHNSLLEDLEKKGFIKLNKSNEDQQPH